MEENLKNYVPRHMRLGVCCEVPEIVDYQETIDNIPVIDDYNRIVSTERVIKQVRASELMSAYKLSAFRLSALIDAGVPLKVVNINRSRSANIEQLMNMCSSVDSAERYALLLEQQQRERDSWLQPDKVKTEVEPLNS